MTIYKDLYSTMNWQDGQEVELDFLNNGQRFLRAQMTDQLLQQLIMGVLNSSTTPEFPGSDGADVSAMWAYCPSPGRAFLRQGSANNKIQLAPGTLLQKIANSNGNDATLVPFTFVGTEEWTLANGDATNPRVDLLQMKISYTTDTLVTVDFEDAVTRAKTSTPLTATRYRPQAELTVKQGTPAASPTIPDPDAGFVPVATAVVGHGWTSAGAAPIFGVDTAEANNVVIHDQRMPTGITSWLTDTVSYKLETAWALANVNQYVTSSNATNRMFVMCPTNHGRLLAVDIHNSALSIGAGVLSLGVLDVDFAAAPSGRYKTANNPGTTATTVVGSSTYVRILRSAGAPGSGFEGHHSPSAGPTILSSPGGYGVPLWTSGYRVPYFGRAVTVRDFLTLSVTNHTNGESLTGVSFLIAG